MKTALPLDSRLLAVIGRRFAASYDALIPRFGPHPDPWRAGGISRVALNPQPLPPHELGAAVAVEFIRAAWLADRFGLDPARFQADLDDWCPTRPKWPKLPLWWPPIPEPDPPHPDWHTEFHLGFAARLATVSSEGTRFGELLGQAIERSVSVIASAATVQRP